MSYRMIALANVKADRLADFESWHDHVHMREVLAITGFGYAERLEMVPDTNDHEPIYRFLIIYEGEGSALEAAMSRLQMAAKAGRLTLSDTTEEPKWAAVFKSAYKFSSPAG